jgi:hypothetical protein
MTASISATDTCSDRVGGGVRHAPRDMLVAVVQTAN